LVPPVWLRWQPVASVVDNPDVTLAQHRVQRESVMRAVGMSDGFVHAPPGGGPVAHRRASRQCSRLIVAVVVGVLAGKRDTIAAPGPTSPDELLAAYSRSCEPLGHAEFTAVTETKYFGFALPSGTVIVEEKIKVLRDGDRWKHLFSRLNRIPGKKGPESIRSSEERSYPGRGALIVDLDKDEKPTSVIARVTEDPDPIQFRLPFQPFGAAFGCLQNNGGVSLADVLRESKLGVRSESADGKPLLVLDGTGRWGRHSLWLDPSKGFLAVRVDQQKGEGDLVEKDTRIADVPIIGGRFFPAARLTGKTATYTVKEAKEINGVFLPTTFSLRDEAIFADGQSVVQESSVRLSEVNLRPNLDAGAFKVTTPLADGTPVYAEDDPSITYEWRDGQVVKAVNRSSIANMEGEGFRRSRASTRMRYTLVALAGTAAAVWGVWRLSRGKAAPEAPGNERVSGGRGLGG
jgi:hypothetical protein